MLFEIIPRKFSVDASKTHEIVAELRAFWQFVQREFGLPNAAECLAVLAPSAAKKLEAKLADPRNFGMAKSLFMAGKQAGFDVETQAGMAAWVREYNAAQVAPVAAPGLSPAGERTIDDSARERQREERKRKRRQRKTSQRRNR